MRFKDIFKRNKIDEETNACVVCGYLTVGKRGMFDICPVCFWEDDGDESNPDEISGGPNGDLTLNVARDSFKKFGATQIRLLAYVRPPRDYELVDSLVGAKLIEERQQAARNQYKIAKDNNPVYR